MIPAEAAKLGIFIDEMFAAMGLSNHLSLEVVPTYYGRHGYLRYHQVRYILKVIVHITSYCS